jgi:ATP-dependent Zn protease
MPIRRLTSPVALLAALTLLAPADALGAVHATEGYQALLSQVRSGNVTVAVINRRPHDVKVTLKSGAVQEAIYPPADEKALARSLRAHGATVKFTKAKKPAVHHKLRYIAAGILGALIVVGGGLWFVSRRQQPGTATPPPGGGGAPTAPPGEPNA